MLFIHLYVMERIPKKAVKLYQDRESKQAGSEKSKQENGMSSGVRGIKK